MNVLFQLIALTGILYQVYLQTTDYLKYNVFSLASFRQGDIRLPAITFCISFWYSELEPVINAHPVGEAENLLPPWKNSILDCAITLPNDSVVSCHEVSILHRYFNSMFECFSLFESDWTLVSEEQLTYKEPTLKRPLFKVELSSPYNFSNHWGLSVRPHDIPLAMFTVSESKMWIEPTINDEFTASFRMTKRIELPAPYPSQCRNYSKTQWIDLDNAIQNCWLEKLKYNGTHYWPKWTMYDVTYNYSQDYESRFFASQEVDSKAFPPVSVECYNKFQAAECEKHYVTLTGVKYKRKNKPLRETTITFTVARMPNTILTIELTPRNHLLGLINECGNILSLWVGLGMFLTLNSLTDTHIRSKNCSRKKPKLSMFEVAILVSNPLYRKRTKKLSVKEINFTCTKRPFESKQIKCILFIINSSMLFMAFTFVVDIVKLYFENPFYVLIMSTVPKETQLSRLSLCFDLFVEREKLSQEEQEKYQNVSDQELIQMFTVNELIKLTVDWADLYAPEGSTFLSSETNQREKIHDYFKFTKTVTGRYTCFSSFGQEQYLKGTIKPYVNAVLFNSKSIELSLNVSAIDKWAQLLRIYYHFIDAFDEDQTAPNRVAQFFYSKKHLYINAFLLRPSRIKIVLNQNHIMNRCTNYSKIFGLSSRLEAIDNCTVTQFVKRFARWPAGYRATESELKFSLPEQHDLVLETRKECEEKLTRPDCDRVYQFLELESEFFHPNYTTIAIYPAKKIVLEYHQKVKYDIIDLIGYIGGTLGWWMGISMVDLFQMLWSARRKFCFAASGQLIVNG